MKKKINFTKMHGIGNDYIYINCFDGIPADPSELAIKMSPRHFSVGSDGIVLICPSDNADAKMRIFNADGSEAKMCGNAIRCVGKYLYERNMARKNELTVDTLSGIKTLTLNTKDGVVESVGVDMGKAEICPRKIPVNFPGESMINEPADVCGKTYRMTAVSMGNPHSVIFCDDPSSLELEKIGTYFENHPLFPDRVNTEFVRVISPTELEMRVWERGSGETYACGTGTCASVVASVLNGYCKTEVPVRVHLIGGDLTIIVGDDLRVTMEGPASFVYDGEYLLDI